MKVGDLVRVKWTRRVSQMNSDNIRKVWAINNTPLLIVDMPVDPVQPNFLPIVFVINGGRKEKMYIADLTTRMWHDTSR